VRITVGRKFSQGVVELFSRKDRVLQEIPSDAAVTEAARLLDSYPI